MFHHKTIIIPEGVKNEPSQPLKWKWRSCQ